MYQFPNFYPWPTIIHISMRRSARRPKLQTSIYIQHGSSGVAGSSGDRAAPAALAAAATNSASHNILRAQTTIGESSSTNSGSSPQSAGRGNVFLTVLNRPPERAGVGMPPERLRAASDTQD